MHNSSSGMIRFVHCVQSFECDYLQRWRQRIKGHCSQVAAGVGAPLRTLRRLLRLWLHLLLLLLQRLGACLCRRALDAACRRRRLEGVLRGRTLRRLDALQRTGVTSVLSAGATDLSTACVEVIKNIHLSGTRPRGQ